MLIQTKFKLGDKAKVHASPVVIREIYINAHDSDKHYMLEVDYVVQFENGKTDRVYENELRGIDE